MGWGVSKQTAAQGKSEMLMPGTVDAEQSCRDRHTPAGDTVALCVPVCDLCHVARDSYKSLGDYGENDSIPKLLQTTRGTSAVDKASPTPPYPLPPQRPIHPLRT